MNARVSVESTSSKAGDFLSGRSWCGMPYVRGRLRSCGVILMALLMAGCASTPKNPSAARIAKAKSDYSEATSVKSVNTYLQGVGLGAAVGAGVGAGIGALAGSVGTGAAVGGLFGMWVGLALADHIVDQRQKFADASAHLKACSLATEKQVEASMAFNSVLEQEIASVRAEDQSLSVALKDSKAVLGSMKAELEKQQGVLERAAKESVSEPDLAQHQTHVMALEREIARLTAHVDRLTEQEQQPVLGGGQ